jgi:sulfopyruvate decarboxylase subunit alpha
METTTVLADSTPAVAPVHPRAVAIWAELKRHGVTHVVWVPDSETHFMHAALVQDPDITVVQVCREGETIGVCAGLYLGGVRAALLVENQGLYDSGNVLKWAKNLGFPIVMLVGFLFFHKMQRTERGLVAGGVPDFTEPFLDAFGIEHHLVDSDESVKLVAVACERAEEVGQPVAVLLAKADDYESGN